MNSKKVECPRCNSMHVVQGSILGHGDIGLGFVFRPKSLKYLRFTSTDLTIPKNIYACCNCGLLWAEIDYKKLVKIITRKGTATLRKKIGLIS